MIVTLPRLFSYLFLLAILATDLEGEWSVDIQFHLYYTQDGVYQGECAPAKLPQVLYTMCLLLPLFPT